MKLFFLGIGCGAILVGLFFALATLIEENRKDKFKQELSYPNRKLREISQDLKTVKNNINNQNLINIINDINDDVILAIAILEDEEREHYDKKV